MNALGYAEQSPQAAGISHLDFSVVQPASLPWPRQAFQNHFAAVVAAEICRMRVRQIETPKTNKQKTKKGDQDETSKSRNGKAGATHRPWRCRGM